MQKGFSSIFLVIGLLIIALIGGAVYFGKVNLPKTQTPVNPEQQSTKSITDETANWKKYTNNKRSYEFKYPDLYKLKETEASSATFESVYLEKDTEYTVGGGTGGSNVLKKGVIISFTVHPKKDLSESVLKSEYGTDITLKTISVDNKEGIEIIFQPERYSGRKIYIKHNNVVLEISSNSGFEITRSDQEMYLSDFNQILSTVKFLEQNQTNSTTDWKTYTNSKYGYQLKYPKDWFSYVPSSDQETLDSICLGQDPNKCVLNITVLEGTSWDREQKLLGLTLSSKEGTKDVSFAGANGSKRVGYFGETGSLYGFVTIVQRNNKVYKIWAYQKTEDQSDYTSEIDQIVSTFKFN